MQRAEQEFNDARRALLELSRDRGALEANEIAYENEKEIRIREVAGEVETAKHRARELGAVVAAEKVLAPVGGHVTEVKVTIGAVVSPARRWPAFAPESRSSKCCSTFRPPTASRSRRECKRWYRPPP